MAGDANGGGQGSQDPGDALVNELTAAGKYLLVQVPDFAADPVGPRQSQQMTSFLRLGAFHERPEEEAAQKRSLELAKHAEVVSTGQGGHLNPVYGGEVDTNDTGVEGRGVFLADQRTWHAADGTLEVPERLKQSAALLTRGGWWDHSDGNRISTTFGDKVEVIRGNYKMVVMHRQDDPAGGGGWDLSGGHVQDLGPNSMPGASVRVEFRPGMFGKPGTWHLENTTNNFIQTSDYAGDFFEHWYGNLKQSTVGSEAPQEWKQTDPSDPTVGKPFGNPHITEKTWAKKIESYTGSAAWRIPEMIESTYAVQSTSTTDVSTSITETTYCDGTISSSTGSSTRRVPMINEKTYAVATDTTTDVGASIETNTIGSSNTTTKIGTSTEVTMAGAQASVTLAGAQAEVEIVGVKGSVSIVGFTGELSVGLKLGAVIGVSREFQIGNHDTIDIPKKKDARLDSLEAAVKDLKVAVDKKSVSVTNNILAVQVKLTAIQVNIGI